MPRFSDIFIASHTLHDNRKRRKQVAAHRMKSALSAKVFKKKDGRKQSFNSVVEVRAKKKPEA